MKLWTIQPPDVVDILERDGIFTCDTKLSENYKDFHDAYVWLVGEMDKRDISRPKNVDLPLWAWHTRDWKHKKPDFRTMGLGRRGERYACIEFKIPDEKVLLSDYDNWHFILNRSWFDDSKNEEEWEELHAWYDSLPYAKQYKMAVESWQKVFDVKPEKSAWCSKGRYIQATFWELTKDMVTDIKYFIAK